MAQSQMQKTRAACTGANNTPLRILADNINHWSNTGDWEPLAYLMVHHPHSPLLRRITSQVLHGKIKGEMDKKSKWGFTFAKPKGLNDLTNKRFADLRQMVENRQGVATRIKVQDGAKEKTVVAVNHFFPTAKPKVEDDAEKVKERYQGHAKRVAERDGLSIDAQIAILQAMRPSTKPTVQMPTVAPTVTPAATDTRTADVTAH